MTPKKLADAIKALSSKKGMPEPKPVDKHRMELKESLGELLAKRRRPQDEAERQKLIGKTGAGVRN